MSIGDLKKISKSYVNLMNRAQLRNNDGKGRHNSATHIFFLGFKVV